MYERQLLVSYKINKPDMYSRQEYPRCTHGHVFTDIPVYTHVYRDIPFIHVVEYTYLFIFVYPYINAKSKITRIVGPSSIIGATLSIVFDRIPCGRTNKTCEMQMNSKG